MAGDSAPWMRTLLQRSPGCHRRPSGRRDHDDRLDDRDATLTRRLAVRRRRRRTAWGSRYGIIDQGLVGFTEVTGQPVTMGAVWERRRCALTGGVVFTGCSCLPSRVTKPRPISVLGMVEVEELRDPAACIPTVRQALDCSRSCGLARSTNTVSRLVKFRQGTWGTGRMCWDSPW